MKKGYDVILSLRYTTTVKVESEEEDEEKIMDEATLTFVDGIRGTGDADDIIGEIEAVSIKKNYSEQPDGLPPEGEELKTYEVGFMGDVDALDVTVKAKDEKEAEEKARDIVQTKFTSDDEKTWCDIDVTFVDYIDLIEPGTDPRAEVE